MRVLNICRFLPIKGFPAENDITFKIYADLKKEYGIESLFVMPERFLPKWSKYLKKSTKDRYDIINSPYKDPKYKLDVFFFQSFFPRPFFQNNINLQFYNYAIQFEIYKNSLFKKVEEFDPFVIHAHTLQDAFYAYKIYKKFNIPYIITLRGKYSNLYSLNLAKKILKNARKIVTPSFSLKEKLKKRYRIKLLPHGLDEEWYLRDNKKFDSDILRIVTVSRLLNLKNIDLVIKSIDILKNQNFNIQYSIIGEGAFKTDLENLVDKLNLNNEIIFHGFKSSGEIKEIFKKSDIFVLLSNHETFGRVYFEAAAQGLLIIGRKGTGADGYFKKGEAFFLEHGEDELANVLKKINQQKFDKMTSGSRSRLENFKNIKIIDEYYQVLKD